MGGYKAKRASIRASLSKLLLGPVSAPPAQESSFRSRRAYFAKKNAARVTQGVRARSASVPQPCCSYASVSSRSCAASSQSARLSEDVDTGMLTRSRTDEFKMLRSIRCQERSSSRPLSTRLRDALKRASARVGTGGGPQTAPSPNAAPDTPEPRPVSSTEAAVAAFIRVAQKSGNNPLSLLPLETVFFSVLYGGSAQLSLQAASAALGALSQRFAREVTALRMMVDAAHHEKDSTLFFTSAVLELEASNTLLHYELLRGALQRYSAGQGADAQIARKIIAARAETVQEARAVFSGARARLRRVADASAIERRGAAAALDRPVLLALWALARAVEREMAYQPDCQAFAASVRDASKQWILMLQRSDRVLDAAGAAPPRLITSETPEATLQQTASTGLPADASRALEASLSRVDTPFAVLRSFSAASDAVLLYATQELRKECRAIAKKHFSGMISALSVP